MFDYLVSIGIATILLSFVWNIVCVVPFAILALITELTGRGRVVGFVPIRAFRSYLLSALMALLTCTAIRHTEGGWITVVYAVLGLLMMVYIFGDSQNEAKKHLEETYVDIVTLKQLNVGATVDLIAIFAYLVMLFVPSLAVNAMTIGIIRGMSWVCGLPIIGPLLYWFAGASACGIALYSAFLAFMLIALPIASISNKRRQRVDVPGPGPRSAEPDDVDIRPSR